MEFEEYLRPTYYLDHDSETVVKFANFVGGQHYSFKDKAVELFFSVRDGIRYDPYRVELTPEGYRASTIIKKGYGYCVHKAIVLCAVARLCGIPSRLGFADVKNHLTTQRLREWMRTDLFVYHGYTEFFLGGKWVKATPTFNKSLCQKFGVKVLDFDGENDALFQPYDSRGQKHMEYVNYHGSFSDVPFEKIFEMFRTYYRVYFEDKISEFTNFDKQAEGERDSRE